MVLELGLNRRRNFRLCAGPSRAQQNTEAMRIGDAGLVRPPNGHVAVRVDTVCETGALDLRVLPN
jgi:hypothetical protein